MGINQNVFNTVYGIVTIFGYNSINVSNEHKMNVKYQTLESLHQI